MKHRLRYTVWVAAVLLASVSSVAQAAGPPLLAEVHQSAGVACTSCHGKTAPGSLKAEESLRIANQACGTCHGDMKAMAAVSKPKLTNPHVNPHASHLVQIDCITCHRVHKPEASYCQECHEFNAVMPAARRGAAAK